jgi:hypothetical protein
VVPDAKILYVSVTKVACTSLRWMIADLAGEDLKSFYATNTAHQTRLMTIHRDRQFWKKSPQLFKLSKSEIAEISRDNGWFIFAVIRDPWSRLWSGWQSKFLVRHKYYVDHFQDRPWFPRVPEKQQDVVDDFRAFVMARPWETDPALTPDVHFQPQVESVRPRLFNYSRVYDLSDMSTLFADLHAHLKSVGMDRELYLPRANDTPLPLIPAVLENGVAEAIEDAYRADFEEYGDRWSLATVKMQDSWTDDAIRHAVYHTIANQRIGDMSVETARIHAQLRHARARNKQLTARLNQLEARSVSGNVQRLGRRVGDVARRGRRYVRRRLNQ